MGKSNIDKVFIIIKAFEEDVVLWIRIEVGKKSEPKLDTYSFMHSGYECGLSIGYLRSGSFLICMFYVYRSTPGSSR